MGYPFLIYSLVSLIVGLALVLAWRRHREQRFLRALGYATLLQGLAPAAYLWWHAASGIAAGAAALLQAFTIVGHVLLLLVGAASLAGKRLPARALVAFGAAMALVHFGFLRAQPQVGQAVLASLNLAVCLLAARWLWPQPLAERLSGVLLVALGVNSFSYVLFGDAALQPQVSTGTVLRVGLGMSLLYAALRRSGEVAQRLHDQYLRMTEKSQFGVIVIQGERVPYANRAAHAIYNLPRERPFPLPWRSRLVGEADRARALARHQAVISGEAEQVMWEGPRERNDGRQMYLRFASWRIEWDGRPAEQVVVIDDTEHQTAAQALLYQATHDGLTGLPNRSALLNRLSALCDEGRPFGLLLMDVDRFRLFNEAHGPSVADEVLSALASALRQAAPSRAELMRLGEDEFALLLPLQVGEGAEMASLALAGRVRDRLHQPLELPDHSFYVDMSIGLATHPETAGEPEALLRAAQAAMHRAKRMPGLSVCRADAGFERGSGASLQAEQALRAGLRNEEFLLVYQPKVDARHGRPTGFEALVRWQRPGVGVVSPADFIPAAERTGLIGALGTLILDKACAQIAAWLAAGETVLPVAVNVSPLQLLDPDFAGVVARCMALHRVPPQYLTIEITETAAATHLDEARQRIAELGDLGLKVALDDFGAGVSSLNILRSLPLQVVKIDRLLIDPLPATDALAVVRAVCQLARALNLGVVAEGVETMAQAEAALVAGCNELQGFHFSRPLPPHEALAWLRRHQEPAGVAPIRA
ncbi:MAG TPA: bifunctional diguanylate cyclase/phosphodiesterase [Ideonella sp.]|jgi:diguanylate cyclase (GGDEF)-like protein/PAS domain S-box-containing protein|nr:bifunctional diguanylate cyclase/phosphodiesterase [Ideonella sp.]